MRDDLFQRAARPSVGQPLTRSLFRAVTPIFEGHSGQVTAVAISPDNQRVATGTADGLLLLWDAAEVARP